MIHRYYLVLVSLALLLAAVAYTVSAQDTVERTGTADDFKAAGGEYRCRGYAIDHLKAAVDPTRRVDQDWNLKAAEAYLGLAAIGAEC